MTTHTLGDVPLSGFRRLPDIDDVAPLSDSDAACLSEIREVLDRHDALDRFGLTLLHEHFDLEHDEVLVEETDPETRTLTIRPQRESDIKADTLIQTNWRLDTVEGLVGCSQVCAYTSEGHKKTGHLPSL